MTLHKETKFAAEDEPYAFDFARRKVIKDGDTLLDASPDVIVTSGGSDLLVNTAASGAGTANQGVVSGNRVIFWLRGGTAGSVYHLKCTVTTANGATLVGDGKVEVK